MKRPIIALIVPFLLIPFLGFPQVDNIVVQNFSTGGRINYAGFTRQMPSSDNALILGWRYWDNDWRVAAVKIQGTWMKVKSVKLDLFQNEIHFLNEKGDEVVAMQGLVKKIAFYDRNDTTAIAAFFQALATRDDKSDSLGYVQILNDGETQILKKVRFQMFERRYDPMIGKHEMSLSAQTHYLVAHHGELARFELSKSNVILLLSGFKNYREWIKSHRLKSEEDIVAFLKYCQQQEKSDP